MREAIFDSITNSEQEMLLRAGIKKCYAPTYLRAYIMASLCIEEQFVISDSAASLNRAFRTLIDCQEGEGYYTLKYLPKEDFEWLIREGYIRFAARDQFKGDFSSGLREAQKKMQTVDQPSERYTKRLDEICSNEHIYWYNLDNVTRRFTSKFKKGIKEKLNRSDLSLREERLIRQLMDRLADQEMYTYGGIKSTLLEYLSEEDQDYKDIRKILRKAYEDNVPDELDLDYLLFSENAGPLSKSDGRLILTRERRVEANFACSIYGFATLPAKRLRDIWASSEYGNFRKQIDAFRNGVIDLDEYLESLCRYFRVINERVSEDFTQRYYQSVSREKWELSSVPIEIRQYFRGEEPYIVAAKVVNTVWNVGSFVSDIFTGELAPHLIGGLFSKVLPAYAKKKSDFPELPKEVTEAIIMQPRDLPQIGENSKLPESV